MTDELPADAPAKKPASRGRMIMWAVVSLVSCGIIVAVWPKDAINYRSKLLTRAAVGDTWPLTVDSGMLLCEGTAEVAAVKFVADGKTYAVNGTAMRNKSLADIHDIWLPGMDISPVLNTGLQLCK